FGTRSFRYEELRKQQQAVDTKLGPRREPVARPSQSQVGRLGPGLVELHGGADRTFDPDPDVVASTTELGSRLLLQEEGVFRQAARQAEPNVLVAVVQSAKLQGDLPASERRASESEPGH